LGKVPKWVNFYFIMDLDVSRGLMKRLHNSHNRNHVFWQRHAQKIKKYWE